jgi:hypothetical protein
MKGSGPGIVWSNFSFYNVGAEENKASEMYKISAKLCTCAAYDIGCRGKGISACPTATIANGWQQLDGVYLDKIVFVGSTDNSLTSSEHLRGEPTLQSYEIKK